MWCGKLTDVFYQVLCVTLAFLNGPSNKVLIGASQIVVFSACGVRYIFPLQIGTIRMICCSRGDCVAAICIPTMLMTRHIT